MQGNLIAHLHTRTVWVWDKENDQMVTVRLLIGKDKNKTSFAFPMGYTKILVILLRLTLFIMTDFANSLRELLGITDYFMISEIKKKEYPKETIEIHLKIFTKSV